MKSSAVILLTLALASASVAQTSTAPKSTATTKKSTTATHKTTGATAHKATSASAHKSATASKTPMTLKDTKEKFSYALGLSLGSNLHRQDVDIDPEIVARGLKDALTSSNHLLTDQEAAEVLQQMQTSVREKQMAKLKEMEEKNKADGAAFLAANKTKPGVVTLPSGLQYKVITEGTGPKPAATDKVVCNYRGTLIDGKEFDSSYKRGQPATFPVNGVIKGWSEALQLMPVGSKWELYVPSDLAYGDRGAGPDITPGSTLIFEVELLKIDNAAAGK